MFDDVRKSPIPVPKEIRDNKWAEKIATALQAREQGKRLRLAQASRPVTRTYRKAD